MEKVKQSNSVFKIENNVLIGEEAPIYKKSTNVGKLVLDALESRPAFVGQVDAVTGREMTYAEIRERSVKCALWLKRQGIQRGDIIGICTGNHFDSCIPLLGGLYIAAIINPWDSQLSVVTARYFLTLTTPKAVFVDADSARNVVEAAKAENLSVKIVVFGEFSEFQSFTEIFNGQFESSEVDRFQCTGIESPDDVATIVCSSGTTGMPKGSEISHTAMINYMQHVAVHDLTGHVCMWTPTMRWYCGLFIILQAILKYSTRIVIPDFDDDEIICKFIEKYKVTWFRCDSCFPIRLLKFDILKKFALPSLKILLFGGSHFRRDMQKALVEQLSHTNVLQSYGMTDFGGLCACQNKHSKPGSCGFICSTAKLKVVDVETGKLLGPNETGEIWAKSSYMMKGYHKNPEATLRSIDSEGWLHTGDLGYYDADGEIFLVNRISEFINYRSINVSPAEIEAVIQTHPAVLEVAVVPVPHDVEEEHALAFVTRVPGQEVTEEELTNLVDRTLPWHSRLHAGVKFMGELPRTATGKIAKKELKQIARKNFIGK